MVILKKLFLSDKLDLFTSNKNLHYLTKLHLFFTEEKDTEWVVPHRFNSSSIFTQVFQTTEGNTIETIFADSIIHTLNDTTITFSQPQKGVVFLICPQVSQELNWEEITSILNSFTGINND